jgi:hypothetical protein
MERRDSFSSPLLQQEFFSEEYPINTISAFRNAKPASLYPNPTKDSSKDKTTTAGSKICSCLCSIFNSVFSYKKMSEEAEPNNISKESKPKIESVEPQVVPILLNLETATESDKSTSKKIDLTFRLYWWRENGIRDTILPDIEVCEAIIADGSYTELRILKILFSKPEHKAQWDLLSAQNQKLINQIEIEFN